MTVKQRITATRWWAERSGKYRNALMACGELATVGRGLDRADLVDYSQLATTPDQLRIEDHMVTTVAPSDVVLHIGVGNSGLAERISGAVARIDGITVSDAELQRAISMGLSNYRVVLANKYSREVIDELGGPYDVIVDNNLASFACCQFHVRTMVDSYARLLSSSGRLLTDRGGMAWSVGDPRWKLTTSDLEDLFGPYSLDVVAVDARLVEIRPRAL